MRTIAVASTQIRQNRASIKERISLREKTSIDPKDDTKKSYLRLFSRKTPSSARVSCLISDISKSESKLVTSRNIKCEKTSKPIKKTLIIRTLNNHSHK